MEWTDDLELFILKGYGNALNYRMGVLLLEDIVQSMDQAIKAQEGLINHIIYFCTVSIVLQLCAVSISQSTPWLNLFLDVAGQRRLMNRDTT